ncbi:hypothetical protein KCP73_17585 [Salmonella enterica subsp. enterica]|nr:hypothetical protein KCP73_17585 [Salmonella enterica subsp. enterica]
MSNCIIPFGNFVPDGAALSALHSQQSRQDMFTPPSSGNKTTAPAVARVSVDM